MSPDGEIGFAVDGAVATLTLRRPEKLNAVTAAMTRELAGYAERIDADDALRAVVLTGTGKAFCAGSDLGEVRAYADRPWDFRNRVDYVDVLREFRKPVVAAINGYAYGGGLELAMACDVRLAAEHAVFAAPEIKLGWVGGAGQSYGLLAAAGPGNAAWLLLTGDPVDADTARSWGLVTRVLPAAELMTEATALAHRIAERPPIAAQAVKANLRMAAALPAEQAIGYERDLQAFCFATKDAAEGLAAFTEQREARFRGR